MSADICQYIGACETCATFSSTQPKEPLKQHEVCDRPWQKVATDIFELKGRFYLVTVDYFSNFIEVDYLPDTLAETVVSKLKQHFARHGVPDIVISDGGPQYASGVFAKFAATWGFIHNMSSPGNSQSNGLAESAVKTTKRIMKKALHNHEDPYIGLLNHRNTPTDNMSTSPAQRLFKRRTKTLLPTTQDKLLDPTDARTTNELLQKKFKIAEKHKSTKTLPRLTPGTKVMVQPIQPFKKEWRSAIVTKQLTGRRYQIENEEGKLLERNRRFLKPIHIEKQPSVTGRETVSEPTVPPKPPKAKMTHTKTVEKSTKKLDNVPYITRSGREVRMPKKYSN